MPCGTGPSHFRRRVAWASGSLPVVITETRANKFAHATQDAMHPWDGRFSGLPGSVSPP